MAPKKKKEEQAAPSGVKFEEALEKLEASVRLLDSADLPLEQALAEYEKGLEALKLCRGILDAAERKLEILVNEKDGAAVVEEFEPDEVEGDTDGRGVRTREARATTPASKPPAKKTGEERPEELMDGDAEGPVDKAPRGRKDGFLF